MTTLQTDHFAKALDNALTETFESVQGIYLDKGTSLFETLATISAEEASIPVGGKCATLAAQVKHITFYLDVLEEGIRKGEFVKQDWGKIWRETGAVSPEEWQGIKAVMRESYERTKALINEPPAWSTADDITNAIAIVVHSAYHLGEIRQALCVIKS